MGWFSRLIHKDTDIISNMFDLEPWLKAIGFDVQKAEDISQGGVLLNRLKLSKGSLRLAILWDGRILNILQKHDLPADPNFRTFQDFHMKTHYFVLTYGQPGHTLIVKTSMFMSLETPVVASSIERLLSFWQDHLNLVEVVKPFMGDTR